jgi:ribonuclease HI
LREIRPAEVEFLLDSELVVRQLKGEYKVKEPRLQKLYGQAVMLLNAAGKYKIRHVRREENARADELANEALDAVG